MKWFCFKTTIALAAISATSFAQEAKPPAQPPTQTPTSSAAPSTAGLLRRQVRRPPPLLQSNRPRRYPPGRLPGPHHPTLAALSTLNGTLSEPMIPCR